MNMPASIKVGPHVYSVLKKPAADMKGAMGWCDFDAVQIWIKNRLKQSKQKEILIHELLHACTHPSFSRGEKLDDETFVTAVAPVLLGVLRDNPELVEYLTK